MSRILIAGGGTGGHLMPALALADALRTAAPDVDPVLVGAARGVDAGILPGRDFRYHLIPAEPIYRRAWWRNVRWPVVLWRVSRAVRRVLADERPDLVVGTGGYAAGPMLFAAVRHRIPIALQEQNAYPGITTRWLAKHARQIHLGFPEAERYLTPGASTQVFAFGNPITPPPSPLPEPGAARRALGVSPDRSTVFVMGGSQGARRINEVAATLVRRGAFDAVTLLWSTGRAAFDLFTGFHDPPRRLVRAFWDPIGDAYGAADLVISRSGAMSTAELCAWGLPSVLVPLPSSAADHQTRNAEALAGAGAAVHLPESELSAERLVACVRELLDAPPRLQRMGAAAAARGRPEAARRITESLMALMP